MRFADWIRGARPKTLPLAVAPVITGAAVASVSGAPYDTRFLAVMLLCMGVALFLQIAANFANDYSDGIRGTDEHRDAAGAAGHAADEQAAVRAPARLVASGVNPRRVLFAAGTNAVAACACGLAVCALTGYWWFIVVGVASLLAAWCYVGGSHPYGYHYLGEVFVFVFFGLVAACGTMFALSGRITAGGVGAGAANGLVAVAVLCVNNLRDIESDREHGKHTWMTAFGQTWGTVFADALLVVASILAIALVAGWFVSIPVIIAVCVFMCVVQIAACDAISRVDYRRALPLCTLGSLSVSLVFAAAAFLV
ncbi:1,4-dihydroxy-2-naphthoate octaprenyltransferase [Bifidobacterium thermacidophilum subsp. thermacidophilum]|uniref:1,4-dihydroxy-2-naphthoate octaprenyltransferase n=2 Tax=Bifidobacterium thermacidophilum TaxID=246618 RepID=A0A087E6E9_9BIFI|nr:1,4-dihydroxy-2-naphthoate octaprenyltransferase [Bifidobacterium thermacidophilum subsp. thermacidophilum]